MFCPVLGFGQNQGLISGTYEEVLLSEVLKDWTVRYGVHFSYPQELVAEKTVVLSLHSVPLPEALDQLLEDQGLDCTIRANSFVVLMPKVKTPFLCGWLLSQEDELPLVYAMLKTRKSRKGTMTQADGSFYLKGPFQAGEELLISHVGYRTRAVSVDSLLKLPCTALRMSEQTLEIPGITISEYLTDGISKDAYSLRLQPNRLRSLPGQVEPDLFSMAQVIPGISSPSETTTGLHIRGGTPDQNLVLMNGVPMYQTGHFFDMVSAINPYAVEEARIYRGGFGAGQSGRVSGLIDIQQGTTIPDTFSGGLGLTMTHLNADIKVPLANKKAALFVSGRTSLTNYLPQFSFRPIKNRLHQLPEETEAEYGDRVSLFDAYSFSDASFQWIWKPDARNELRLGGIWSKNFLEIGYEEPDENWEQANTLANESAGFSLSWKSLVGAQWKTNTAISFSRLASSYEFREEHPFWNESSTANNSVTDVRFSHEWSATFGNAHALEFGTESRWQQVGFSFTNTTPDNQYSEFNEPSALTQAIWTQHTWNLSKQLHAQTGARISYFSGLDEWYVDPRLRLNYRPLKALKLTAFAGRYHQFVSQLIEDWNFDFSLGSPAQVWFLANDHHAPAIGSIQFGVGAELQLGGWLLEVEAYQKNLTELTSLATSFSNALRLEYEQGDGYIGGIDFLIKKRWDKHRAWLSYTLSSIVYEFADASGEPFFAPHDQTHQVQLMYVYQWKRWAFSTSWSHRTGLPATLIEGVALNFEEGEEPFYRAIPIFGPINEFRLPGYRRIDFSAQYRFPLTERFQGQVGLSLLNATDRSNPYSIEYLDNYYDPSVPRADMEVRSIYRETLRRMVQVQFRLSW
ncbi:MAG: TonB-dependent receptor plug domain-containing protein [Bacteroidota bacterium]